MSHKDLKATFARRLRQAREAVGVSQVELGRQAGLEPSVASPRINQYESGKHLPQATTLVRLAEALGVPVTFLVSEDDSLAELVLKWQAMTAEQRECLLSAADEALTRSPARR